MSVKKTTADLGDDPLITFCRALPATTEDVKWGDNLVFSVGKKMFAVFDLPEARRCSFQSHPLTFDTLTGRDSIVPAPYLARHHWVMVEERACLPEEMLQELIQDSYRLVAAKLPKKLQRELGLEA